MAHDEEYESKDQCLVDIMANTDCHYRVALLALPFIFSEGWSFDNHPVDPRGIIISPDFDAENPTIIHLLMEQG